MNRSIVETTHGAGNKITLYRVESDTLFQDSTSACLEKAVPIGTTVLSVVTSLAVESGLSKVGIDEMVARRRHSMHCRSFALSLPGIEVDGCVTLKGADWSRPYLFRNATPKQSEYFGGMQRADAKRATEAGLLLAEIGVHGERILKIDRPKQLPEGETLKDTAEAVEQLVVNAFPVFTGRALRLYRTEGYEPVIVLRTSPLDLRLRETADLNMATINNYLEAAMLRMGEIEGDYSGMNHNDINDVYEYFHVVLPRVYGEQMGKLASAGKRQMFPHSGNIALDGGVVDLDGIVDSKMPFHWMPKYVRKLEIGRRRAWENVTAIRHIEPKTSATQDYSRLKQEFFLGVERGKKAT